MLSLDLWTLTPGAPGQTKLQHVTFREALAWLRQPSPAKRASNADWSLELLTAHIGREGTTRYAVPLTRLAGGLGFEPEDATTVADTVL